MYVMQYAYPHIHVLKLLKNKDFKMIVSWSVLAATISVANPSVSDIDERVALKDELNVHKEVSLSLEERSELNGALDLIASKRGSKLRDYYYEQSQV